MQQQQQQHQPQQQQQQLANQTVSQTSLQFQLQTQPTHHQQHLGNNIIVVRGSRNEHGEIVIQNKQDIFTFLSEHHQQQQHQLHKQQQQQQHQQQLQQQNEKATVATLTQLPSTTTVARKTSISLIANNVGIGSSIAGNATSTSSSSSTSSAAGAGAGATTVATTIPKETNTILLQTPINASQLETVLLQSGQLKKSNSTITSGTDRPFLFKNASRSLSTDSNRFAALTTSKGPGDDKGPFVLQTLKRLEKSQSILVIRNSSSSSSTATATTASGANSTSSLSNCSSSSATSLTVEHKLSLSSSALSSIQHQQPLSQSQSHSHSQSQLQQQQQVHATTVGVNTTKGGGSTITFTRTKKSHKSNASSGSNNIVATTTAKLGDILASATGQRHLSTTNDSNNINSKLSNATATTTYLRLTNGNTNTNNTNNNNGNNVANNNHKNHNSSRVTLNGNNSETISTSTTTQGGAAAAAAAGAGAAGAATATTTHLTLAEVQLKHERNSPSTTTTGLLKPQGSDGDPIKLPDNLESLPRADSFPSQRHRWNTNEEIAAILISFDKHNEWQSKEVKTRPKSGSLLLYSRKKVRYRRDGYCWKKRKDGKTTREDHMKLKVQGTECIYGCYVHSAILPTFHRRCYWLLQNPDIVLVHYLNVPYPDDNKMAVIAPSISLWGDKKEWTKEELVSQLKPMLSTVTSDDESDSGNDIEISTAETVESIVCQLMEKQRLSRQAALVKQLDCGCGDASCADGKTCTHPVMRRPSLIKPSNEKRLPAATAVEPFNANNAPNVVVGPKLYSRWADKRAVRESANSMDTNGYQLHQGHGHGGQGHQLSQESAIKFQIIPPHSEQQHLQQQQQQQQQHYRHHYNANGSNASGGVAANHPQLIATRNNLIMQHQQQQQQQMHTNQSNFNQVHNPNNNNTNHITNNNSNNNANLQRYTANNSNAPMTSQQHRFQIAKTTITAMDNNTNNPQQQQQQQNNNHNNNNNGLVGASGEIPVDVLNTPNHSHPTLHKHSNQTMGTSNPNANSKINHNTNITSNHNAASQSSHSNQTMAATSLTPAAITTNAPSNIVTTTTMPQLMSTPHLQHHQHHQHQQQNDLGVINNNVIMNNSSSGGNTNNAITKFNNYNHQQLNASNNSNNNNSLSSHTANNQQQHKHALPQEQYYKLQHHKQQQQQSTSNSVAATSTVEPMCMSPEHQPSPPSQHKQQQLQQQQQQQQQQQTHLIISSSDSMPELSSSISSSSSLSSSSQTFMDVNQKSTTPALVNSNNNNNNNSNNHNSNNIENAEMSSNSNDLNTSTSNINNNESSNRNNQLDEYNINKCNINNTNTSGCATSSSDASNCNKSNSNNNRNNSVPSTQHQPLNTSIQNNNNNSNINTCNSQLNRATPTATPSAICFDNLEQGHHDVNKTQEQPQKQQSQVTSELHETMGFFNETLDLSHEDIQRTLIANMPGEGTLLTSIDFMRTPVATGASSTVAQNVQCETDPEVSGGTEADDEDTDDVFANLDAFDMLVEFPELDLDDKQALTNTALEQAVGGVTAAESLSISSSCQNLNQLSQYSSSSTSALVCAKKGLKICDFSPDWSYPEGGVKVLVAGPWSSDGHYTVLFDSQPVPTVLVQEGVLRCYCPSHEVGYATLQVSCDSFVISDSVMFEYKMMSCQEAPFDANTNECLYKFSLYNRLTTIEETMQIKAESVTVTASQQIFSLQGNLEEKLVSYCHQLMKMSWQTTALSATNGAAGYKGMTLLHLAAALGYNKLVCVLLNWRTENPHITLETEIDAFSQDAHGFTPLTWACSRGHLDTAVTLYKWNQNALKIKNRAQQTPLDVAHSKGHKDIVAEIYRLEHERQRKQSRGSLTSLSINLNKYSPNNDDSDEHVAYAIFDSSDSQRSHDGVFLRPVAVASNQSPPNSSRFSKRSSIDSGISMDIRTKPMKSFKDMTRLQSLEAHENFNSSIESPLDTIGTATNTTNSLLSPLRKMDFALCEVSTGDSSPLPDKNNDDDTLTIDNDDCNDDVTIPNKNVDAVVGDSDAKVLTLAEHIIAAMPERIKNEADEMMILGSPMTEPLNTEATGLNDSFMDPLLDSLPNAHFDNEFNFDFNDHSYRYHEASTPCSSLSPASSGPLQSPASYSILGHDPSVSSPSPPPSTKQLTEFLHASSNSQYPFEADFSKLTLTDTEQRELYEAAKCIQKAYRSYKGRQKLEEQNKERTAAIVIQNYYRRYKQFAYYRQMTNAALVIQHGYRSYRRNKRFKKSQTCNSMPGATGLGGLHSTDSQDSTNSQCLSSFFDNFNKQEAESSPQACTTPKETSPSGPLKRTYSQSTQNQAARKIQQFMRQSRIKLQKERAEKEKLVHQRRAEYLQNLRYQGQPEIVCPIIKSDIALQYSNELVCNDSLKNNNHDLS